MMASDRVLAHLRTNREPADEDFHAPNEFFRVHRLHEGLEAWAHFWEILGDASA